MPPIIPRDTEKDAVVWRAQFENMGRASVKAMLLQWQGPVQAEARKWLGEKEREDHSRSEAARAEEMAIAREAKDAALAANTLAESANALARDANTIARDASASAALSATAARTNNIIAMAALAAAIAAIIVSVVAILKHAS